MTAPPGSILKFLRGLGLWLAMAAGADAADQLPFTLAIVPEQSREAGSFISMAEEKPGRFFVVLTNVSKTTQPIWETWNRWGYWTISFELTTSDGVKHEIAKGGHGWGENYPSIFAIPPGERFVFPIALNDDWKRHPILPKQAELAITLKAIYQVGKAEDPETQKFKVWEGKVESKDYKLTLYQR